MNPNITVKVNPQDLADSIEAEKNFDYKAAYLVVLRNLTIARRALKYLAVHQDSATATEALEEMKSAKD